MKFNNYVKNALDANKPVINEKAVAEYYNKLSNKSLSFDQINVDDNNQLYAAKKYLCVKPSLLKELNTENEKQILKLFLLDLNLPNTHKGYTYISSLDASQLSNEVLSCYLYSRLCAESAKDSKIISVSKSFNDNLIIHYNFKPVAGTEIKYSDCDFKVPTTIVGDLSVELKVVDQERLFKTIDLSVSQVGINSIDELLFDWINKTFRTVITDYVVNKKIGYYELPSCLDEIKLDLIKTLKDLTNEKGIQVKDIVINSLDIIEKDLPQKLTESHYMSRINGIKQESRLAFEEESLNNFERKAEIQNKYPNPKDELTEAEKDNALRRYNEKEGIVLAENVAVNVNKSSLGKNVNQSNDKSLEKINDAYSIEKVKSPIKLIILLVFVIIVFVALAAKHLFLPVGVDIAIAVVAFIALVIVIVKNIKKKK